MLPFESTLTVVSELVLGFEFTAIMVVLVLPFEVVITILAFGVPITVMWEEPERAMVAVSDETRAH